MRAALRPYTTAGVALVGASVIAASPVAPPMPDIQEATTRAVSEAQVQLSALANPIEEWAQVFETAFANTAAIGAQIAANPAPILEAIANNQAISAEFLAGVGLSYVSSYFEQLEGIPTAVEAAIGLIEQGQIQQGVQELVTALTVGPIVSAALFSGVLFELPNVAAVLRNPFDNVSNVIDTALNPLTLLNLAPLLLEPLTPVLQLGVTGQAIYDGIEADDYEAVVNALISLPSDMANTVINGSTAIGSGGLLGQNFGVVTSLLGLRELIAPAIQPPAIPPSMALTDTFSPTAVADTGSQGGQLVQLGSPESKASQQVPSTAALETKAKDADKVTNTGATVSLVSQTGGTTTGSDGPKANKPGERMRTAFEGTVERIEKGFDDAVKGFDNALKGLGASNKKADKGGADTSGAGASEATSTGS